MNHQVLSTPWASRGALYSTPGELLVKLRPGEAPEAIPAALDVWRGARDVATQLGVGAVDRMLRTLADEPRITRVHASAAQAHVPGCAHLHYSDIEHVCGLSRTFRVRVTTDRSVTTLIDALRQLTVVEAATPHYLATLPFAAPAPEAPDIRAVVAQVRAAEAQAYEPGDPTVIIAVVDTGVVRGHRELPRMRPGLDTVQLDRRSLAAGLELVGDLSEIDTDPEDLVGHGTACAAIIGAHGLAIPTGLAGACSLLPIRVLGAAKVPGKDRLVGVGALADINEGVKRCIDLGAKVINMSFGTPEAALDENDPTPHADVVRYGLARGCILVAASGNSGAMEDYAPASLPGVIAVGAAGVDGRPAGFSTSGEHVALAAPGERVLSAGLDGYQYVTGTSFAAPFVAAAAALLVSRAARRAHPLGGADVRRLLRQTVRPWPRDVPPGHGAGILDAYAALRALDAEIDRPDVPHAEHASAPPEPAVPVPA